MQLQDATIRKLSPEQIDGENISVDPSDNLQTEIDDANAGDTLIFEAGTYELPAGGIELGSNITLEGVTGDPDDVVLVGNSTHDVSDTNYLNVKNPPEYGITLKHFTLDSGFDYDDRDWSSVGIGTHLAVISADNTLIDNCKFLNGTRDCLDISQSVNVTVRGCVLEDAFTDDVLEINDTSEATGMRSLDPRSNHILIEDCEIRRAGWARLQEGDPVDWAAGIEIEDTARYGTITIRGCIFEENTNVDLDVQGEVGTRNVRPHTIVCENNDFGSGSDEYHDGNGFAGTIGNCLSFDDDNKFVDDNIDNVLTGYRNNISAPNWGIENCD